MAAVRVGDFVLGSNGQPTEVLATSAIDPHPSAYQLTFADGAVIRADGRHKWQVRTNIGTLVIMTATWARWHGTMAATLRRPDASQVALTTIERTDAVPMRCIQVAAADGVYLCGPTALPTHNSDLLLGAARTQHHQVLLLRRGFPDLERSLILRSSQLYGNPALYNASKHVWKFPDGQRIEFGHLEHLKNLEDYQSAQYDMIGFDELVQFPKEMYVYMLSRLRTTRLNQRVRVVSCTNPGGEGNDWVLERWAAWLDPDYPKPAKMGEVRWYKLIDDKHEVECDEGDPDAVSRSFIPAFLSDNPSIDLAYRRRLALLPQPWKDQLLYGSWAIGQTDDAHQIIPTQWIRAAQQRWTPGGRLGFLTCLGCDPAHGGEDQTVIASRYGYWLGELKKTPGVMTPSGTAVTDLLAPLLSRGGYCNLDMASIGASAYDEAVKQRMNVIGYNLSAPSQALDRSGKLRFVNLRAEMYWRLREALDPDNEFPLALPPDPELSGDLRAQRWQLEVRGIQVVDKDDIRKTLGRSPDCGDAVALTMLEPQHVAGGVGRIF